MGVIMQVETDYYVCWVWGHLARDPKHSQAGFCLFGVYELLGNSAEWAEARLLVWGSHWKKAGQGWQIEWNKVSGNHQGGANGVRLKETSDLVPTWAGLCWWEKSSTKAQWCLPVLLSLEGVNLTPAPLALSLKLVNLVPSNLSLALLELLPLCWSLAWVSLWVSLRMVPLRPATPLSLAVYCLFLDTVHAGFHSQIVCRFLFLFPALMLWGGEFSVVLGTLIPQGSFRN